MDMTELMVMFATSQTFLKFAEEPSTFLSSLNTVT